jgi:hypothetical protein
MFTGQDFFSYQIPLGVFRQMNLLQGQTDFRPCNNVKDKLSGTLADRLVFEFRFNCIIVPGVVCPPVAAPAAA